MIIREANYSLEDSRLLVKGALEFIEDIETYHENSHGTIVAKTGFRWGLIASSYGESLTIRLRAIDISTTEVSVHAEKEVAVNIGANPERYAIEFIEMLDTLAEYPLADAIEVIDEQIRERSKEVRSGNQQANGANALLYVLIAIFIFFFIIVFI